MINYLLSQNWVLYWLPLSVVFTVIYRYYTRNFNYFTKMGVNGPKPVIIFGNLWELLFTSKDKLDIKRVRKYGKLFGIFDGNKPLLQIADPVLIKQILVKDFHMFTDRPLISNASHPIANQNLSIVRGQHWRRMRSMVSPTFTSGRMRQMYPMLGHCLQNLLATLDEYTTTGGKGVVDAYRVYGHYAMDTIAAGAWGMETDALRDPNNPMVLSANRMGKLSGGKIFLTALVPPQLLVWLNIRSVRNEGPLNAMIELIGNLVREHRKSYQRSDDFIGLLLRAKPVTAKGRATATAGSAETDESRDYEGHHINDGTESKAIEKKVLDIVSDREGEVEPLTDEEIIGNSLFFFIAGYEQMAATLSYITYELALNPDKQEKLYQEVSAVARAPVTGSITTTTTAGKITSDDHLEIPYDVLATLPYLDAVTSESMRIHSSPIKLRRYAMDDYVLPGTGGVRVLKGQEVQIPTHGIHHMDEYFPESSRFIPERFMPENRHKLTPYTYLPFGAGPRHCVGMRFALMEAKYALAHIVLHYRLSRCPETAVPPAVQNHPLLKLPQSVMLAIERRV